MPNRASDLVWDEPAPPAPAGLTRAAVVDAAIALADAHGLDAVSIRRVAAELGARPMSLYTHIAAKDDLLDLMLNQTVAAVILPEPLPSDWREALREIARRSFAVFVAHPWVLDAFGRRPHLGPNVLRHAEQSAAAVAALGLSPRDAWTLLGAVDDYTLGHALRMTSLAKQGPHPVPDVDPAAFPELARVSREGRADPSEDAFDIGLDAMLDGLERRFALR